MLAYSIDATHVNIYNAVGVHDATDWFAFGLKPIEPGVQQHLHMIGVTLRIRLAAFEDLVGGIGVLNVRLPRDSRG